LYKWTVEDYHQIIESGILEGKSVELLAGEIITISPEKPIHSSRIDTVADYLREILQGTAKVREAHPVTLDNSPHSRASEPEPDIAVVRFEADNYANRHPYPQDIYWLIEVANNTLNKDLEDKSIIYAQNGIPECWVIDLPHNKLWVLTQPEQNGYASKQEIVLGEINPVSFPDISIEVGKLLPNK
jgi:Uma2 family endonuclease